MLRQHGHQPNVHSLHNARAYFLWCGDKECHVESITKEHTPRNSTGMTHGTAEGIQTGMTHGTPEGIQA
jgi:hypothetical protein